jgi:hypothetical protein
MFEIVEAWSKPEGNNKRSFSLSSECSNLFTLKNKLKHSSSDCFCILWWQWDESWRSHVFFFGYPLTNHIGLYIFFSFPLFLLSRQYLLNLFCGCYNSVNYSSWTVLVSNANIAELHQFMVSIFCCSLIHLFEAVCLAFHGLPVGSWWIYPFFKKKYTKYSFNSLCNTFFNEISLIVSNRVSVFCVIRKFQLIPGTW